MGRPNHLLTRLNSFLTNRSYKCIIYLITQSKFRRTAFSGLIYIYIIQTCICFYDSFPPRRRRQLHKRISEKQPASSKMSTTTRRTFNTALKLKSTFSTLNLLLSGYPMPPSPPRPPARHGVELTAASRRRSPFVETPLIVMVVEC